ncbi:MAG: nickel pincer cofactor biosynthesis protein LarB [Pseudomonadota bacterium]|nr:nickel pincer cofactor biosynthesis protein LarB [Pseudomonadota bacterium]
MSETPETHTPAVLDFDRNARIGLSEAVFCEHKTPEQIEAILKRFHEADAPCLLTRLAREKADALSVFFRERLDYDALSRTAFCPCPLPVRTKRQVAIVSGGTSDAPVCLEAARTLEFHGMPCALYQDVGVTGLWRLLDRIEAIRKHPVVIAVAGMEGALFSALGGLIAAPLIAVPTSVGYGVAEGGQLSLNSALSSCAPGILAVNIDNGYGAACAAMRILNASGLSASHQAPSL